MKNVVLLTIDTLRRDMLGSYNPSSTLTPFLDSITDRAMRFERNLSTGPYTQASFPGILTSSYYLEYGKQSHLPPSKVLISEVLKEHGITTAAFHSNPYLSDFFGYNRGWNMFYDSMDDEVSDMYPFIDGEGINRKVEGWLKEYVKTGSYNPFFLWVHYMGVHEPYIPDNKPLKKVDGSIDMTKEQMYDLFKTVILKRDVSNRNTVGLLKRLYSAKVLEADGHTKALYDLFEETNVLEQTIVIIGSDHGDEFGEHGGLSHDGKMYRELIEVPLMIYDPSMNGGEVFPHLTSNIDIAPTVCTLFGCDQPVAFRGASLLPTDRYIEKGCYGEAMNKYGHKEKEIDRPIYFYQEGMLKIIFRDTDGSWELYDTENDPEERNNIFNNSAQARGLKEKLIMYKEKQYDG
jgi:arylsulfatase A-like enzyme